MLVRALDTNKVYVLVGKDLYALGDAKRNKDIATSKDKIFRIHNMELKSNGDGTATSTTSSYTINYSKFKDINTEGNVEWYSRSPESNWLYNISNGVVTCYDTLFKRYSAVPSWILPKLLMIPETDTVDFYNLSENKYIDICERNALGDYGFIDIQGHWCSNVAGVYRIEIYDTVAHNNSKSISFYKSILEELVKML